MKLCAGIFAASIAMAQLSAPNASGVAMGHLHYNVQNVEANKKFWVALGGVAAKIGSTEAVRFPDAIVLLSPRTASEGTDGSVVNHVAFRVQSLEAVAAAGSRLAGRTRTCQAWRPCTLPRASVSNYSTTPPPTCSFPSTVRTTRLPIVT